MKILTIGDNCVDVYTDEKIGFPGGGCVNVAVYASRFGMDSTYIGAFGKDEAAKLIIESLNKENVNTEKVQFFDGSTALAFIKHINLDRIFLGSDRGVRYELSPERIDSEYYKQFDLIHTTLDGQVDSFLEKWKEMGKLISYDYSHRATSEQIQLLKYVDYAFFSGGDQASKETLIEKAKEYKAMGAGIVTITRGKSGSLTYDGVKIYEQQAIKIDPVDTLACGDVFIASFLTSQLNDESLEDSLEKGAIKASQALLAKGAFGYARDIRKLNIVIEDYVMYDKPRI